MEIGHERILELGFAELIDLSDRRDDAHPIRFLIGDADKDLIIDGKLPLVGIAFHFIGIFL
jgi:hypothetical protein